MSHTPGPWKAMIIPGVGWGVFGLVKPDGTKTPLYHCYSTVNEDDARLIAAAPDLLAACQYMVTAFKAHYRLEYCRDWESAAIHQLEKAIAKAKGD